MVKKMKSKEETIYRNKIRGHEKWLIMPSIENDALHIIVILVLSIFNSYNFKHISPTIDCHPETDTYVVAKTVEPMLGILCTNGPVL